MFKVKFNVENPYQSVLALSSDRLVLIQTFVMYHEGKFVTVNNTAAVVRVNVLQTAGYYQSIIT